MMRNTAVWIISVLVLAACWSDGIRINIIFDHLSGLSSKDRVIFEENAVGSVESIKYNADGKYTVQVKIDKNFENAVTQYTHFRIIADPTLADHKAIMVVLAQHGGTPLKSGVTVAGDSNEDDVLKQLQKDFASGFEYFKKQIDKIDRDVRQYPQSKEYRQLKKSLEDFATELEQKGKETREKIKREWLPKIQQELDKLREILKQSGHEKEIQPLEKEVDRIRKI
jgi:DNA-binding transcriptional ArsR family regulator